jgi:transcription initiation factor TFIID TATA-box-binding protein
VDFFLNLYSTTFPGLVYKIKRPRSSILVFSTGKMVCTGATKDEDVYEAVEDLHRDLEKII